MASVLAQFVSEECTPHIVSLVREEASARSGERYLTFNRFNVRLDLDRGIAVIEDELDPDVEASLSIVELLAALPAN